MGDIYLGDGLYMRDEGYQVILFTERSGSEKHWVALDDTTLDAFLTLLGRSRGIEITVKRLEPDLSEATSG